jgi:anti-sigma B factor antagonist
MDGPGVYGWNGEVLDPDVLHVTIRDGPDGEVLLDVAGQVDLSSAPEFGARMRAAIDSTSGSVTLDLSQVSFMDSAGLEELVRARERAAGRLYVCALHPSVRRVLEITALLEWFPVGAEGAGRDSS